MKIYGEFFNTTPGFCVTPNSTNQDPWPKITGALNIKGTWWFPAYYPLGAWVVNELNIYAPALEWDSSAIAFRRELEQQDATWLAAKKAFYHKGPELDFGITFPTGFEPYAHQRLGIAMVITHHRAFFLWEMGTGKTRTIIDGFRALRAKNPKLRQMLVFAPPVVIPSWYDEVIRCSSGTLKPVIITNKDSSWEEARTADVVLATYARARVEAQRNPNRFSTLTYDVIVADESHSLGNYSAAQTKALLELSKSAARRYLLSGTAADHPGKVYPQLEFLSPAILNQTWTKYRAEYFVFSQYRQGMVVGYKNLDKLNAKIDRVASRVKKRDCIDLPPVTFVDVFYDMVESQAAEYDACIARLRDKELYEAMHKGRGVSVVHGGALVNKLLQILSGFVIEGPNLSICDDCTHMPTCVEAKIQPYTERCQLVQIRPKTSVRRLASKKPEVLKGLLEQIIEADPTNKVIIWATYIEELNDIEAQVKALKLGYVRIDGSSINHIKAYSQRFQEDPECRVYIGQIQSGVGVTLTAANYMIYYSLSWNLTAYKQSLERNNRPGQTRNMVVYRLVCSVPGALDRFLARMLEFKDVVAYTLLEKISCASCAENPRCAKDGIRPFKPGCKYEATVSKPKTITDYVSERKDET